MAFKDNPGWGAAVVGACATFAAYMRATGWQVVGDNTESSARATMRVQINTCPDADALQADLAKQPSHWRRSADGGRWRSVIGMSVDVDHSLYTAMGIEEAGRRAEAMRITLAHLLMSTVPPNTIACADPAITRLNGRVAVYLDCCSVPTPSSDG